jgi:hypothetical protein
MGTSCSTEPDIMPIHFVVDAGSRLVTKVNLADKFSALDTISIHNSYSTAQCSGFGAQQTSWSLYCFTRQQLSTIFVMAVFWQLQIDTCSARWFWWAALEDGPNTVNNTESWLGPFLPLHRHSFRSNDFYRRTWILSA